MTKAELVRSTATIAGISETEAEAAVNAAIDAIFAAFSEDGDTVVHLGPLGTFSTRHEAPHTGSDPKTHEPTEYPAYNRLLFHPSQKLRDAVNA